MMGKYKWVLFDADHTLFDFDKASEEALADVFAHHGIHWHCDMYGGFKKINVQCWQEHELGMMDRDTLVYQRFKRYFDWMKIDLDPVATQQRYLEGLGKRPYLIPGADEILTILGPHLRLGYITNGMSAVQRPRLEMIGWHLKFNMIIIAGEIGHSKPHNAYFRHVHAEMGEPDKSAVLVVGDSLSADIAGGASFGYDTCWFNPQQNECSLERPPDYTITDLYQLTGILLNG